LLARPAIRVIPEAARAEAKVVAIPNTEICTFVVIFASRPVEGAVMYPRLWFQRSDTLFVAGGAA